VPTGRAVDSVAALRRRVRRLERELAEALATQERRVDLVRRAANRRLSAMMKEIATLRHHEARAERLERLLATRTPSLSVEGPANGEDPRLPG
jgi:ubiquinone biosynthesis protein UbiJ